jgi:hypothetical protein
MFYPQNICTVWSVFDADLLVLMLFYFLDWGKWAKKQRSRTRMEQLILRHEEERLMASTVCC